LKANTNFPPCFFRFVSVFVNIIRLVSQHRSGFHQRY